MKIPDKIELLGSVKNVLQSGDNIGTKFNRQNT